MEINRILVKKNEFDSIDLRCFDQFKEGGQLPSFSIRILKADNTIKKTLILKKQVGDYCFFEPFPDCFIFSFCRNYCRLSRDMKSADVFLSDHLRSDGQHEVSYLLMQAYMNRLVATGNFMIHGAALMFQKSGILFCGQSGAGKSTQANLWNKYLNTKMLNYDKPCIINTGSNILVHGSPWSGKESLFLNESAPLKAIVFVKQAKHNKVVKLSPAQAFANIYLHNYVYPLTNDIEKLYTSIINTTVHQIPVYELYCNISETAVTVLFEELFPNINYYDYKKEIIMKYKIKNGFQMQQIADEYIVIPRGSNAVDFSATVVFNESGAYLWGLLENWNTIEELSLSLAEHYSIDIKTAKEDVKGFVQKMSDNGLVDIQ